MTRSYKKDIQLLMSILQRQNNIKEVIKRFGCSQNNLEQDKIKNRIIYCNENIDKRLVLRECKIKCVSYRYKTYALYFYVKCGILKRKE